MYKTFVKERFNVNNCKFNFIESRDFQSTGDVLRYLDEQNFIKDPKVRYILAIAFVYQVQELKIHFSSKMTGLTVLCEIVCFSQKLYAMSDTEASQLKAFDSFMVNINGKI